MLKNILFDLGGVIFDIDFSRMIAAFQDLGGHNIGLLFSQAQQDPLLDDFDIGKIDAPQFRTALTEKLNIAVSDVVFDEAWNALLIGWPLERLQFVKFLRETHGLRTFLFSNINSIHFPKVFEICQAQHGFDNFDDYFEKQYYSHLFGQRKPNVSAFISLLAENNLRPEETLFIDDSIQHIHGAKQAGLQTLHYTKDKSLDATLTSYSTFLEI